MTTPIKRRYNNGVVTSRDKRDLGPGEMRQGTGVYYKPGNKQDAFKLDGRSTFGDTSTSAKVDGLALCQFDSGSDKVLALSNSVVYGATPGATGTFASLFTPTTSPTTMDAAHFNDEWFVGLGTENFVLKTDGTTASMGMKRPTDQPVLSGQTGGLVDILPDTKDDGWDNMERAWDTTLFNYWTSASKNLSSGSSSAVWGFTTSNAGVSRILHVLWRIAIGNSGAPLDGDVTLLIEMSEDGGSTYSTVTTRTTTTSVVGVWSTIPITDTTVNTTDVKVRVTATYNSGGSPVNFYISHIKIEDSPSGNSISASELAYAYSEYDDTNDKNSEVSPATYTSFTAQESVLVTLPSSAENSSATHWRIYRTPDKGALSQLGLVAEVDIGQTSWLDTFQDFGVSEQPSQLVPSVTFQVGDNSTPLLIPRDTPPPALRRIAFFKGGLVGLTNQNKRALHYSVPGFPHSWPSLYYVDAFPLPEHDQLVDVQEVGGSLILAAQAAMIRLDEVPRSVSGTFIASPAVAIAGAPGCVGDRAMTVVPHKGRSHAAWISPENGILVTDGHEWDTISRDIDWTAFDGFDKSGWILHYLKHLRILVFAYTSTSTGTAPDRYYLLHLDDNHIKAGGQSKVTGPHYGDIAAIASGQVSNTTRVYEAHASDGKVYLNLDGSTGADSSDAYNASSENPLIIESGEFREHGWRSVSVLDGLLYHGDFGSGQTATVEVTTGRDASGASSTESKTVALDGNQGHQVFMARSSGQWFSEKITHTGTGRSHIGEFALRVRVQGDEGEQKVTA